MGIPENSFLHTQFNRKFIFPTGKRNLLTDVPGVLVGNCTLADETLGMQTGVTAILPHPGNVFREKCMAACQVINGFGKTTGLLQIEELGQLETPIVLTNTLSVGTAYEAVVEYKLERNPEICTTTGSVNPVICECNDMSVNRTRELFVKKEHIFEAIKDAREDFLEGCVGAGRGMRCHGLKGGIGSASRKVTFDEKEYILGALVLANHGTYRHLRINGETVESLAAASEHAFTQNTVPDVRDKGSIIVILATNCPLSERQLRRISRRATVGLVRDGSFLGNGSGDIVVAFTTANKILHESTDQSVLTYQMLHEDEMDVMFEATAEVVEESIISALYHAKPVKGWHGTTLGTLQKRI